MKKNLLLVLSVFLVSTHLFAQGFSGINTGNYAGITGVMLQPASIVDSRFKFDLNLFSTDVRYSNNYFLLNRNVLLKFNKNNFDDYRTFRSRYLSEAKLAPGERAFFNISNRTQLPLSFMVTLNEKSAVALNFQSRSMIQGRNISQDLAKLAFNSFYHQPLNNRSIDASGVALRSLSWVEAGLTYGGVLFGSGNHFLKGAITAKYLGGVSSLNLSGNNLTLRVNDDSTFNFIADRVNYAHNKNADFTRVFDSRFRPDASALGFDAGLVYEYRGHLNNFRYIRNDDEEPYEVNRRDLNQYIFRLGVSLLDAGMFRFNKPANVNSFRANINNWDIRNARYSSLPEFDTALANRVTALANDPRDYNVYLPGALSVQMDIRFVKGLYLNALAYRPLRIGSEAGTRFNNYGYYSITPRYEKRHFGIYVPYTFFDRNDITDYRDNWLGVALRMGPLFFGSNNLGSMAFRQELKAADFFVGLKIGFTYGKPSRISRLLTTKKETDYDRLVAEKENSERDSLASTPNRGDTRSRVNRDTAAANRLVVDYSKGQVFTDGRSGQVVIVNNHYYYGNAAANAMDSVNVSRGVPANPAQRRIYNLDSASRVDRAQKQRADSVNRVLSDSLLQKREQLDSLIDRLHNLRQKLDSAESEGHLSGYNDQGSSDAASLPGATAQNDSLRITPLQKDSMRLNTAQTAGTESAKKKVKAPPGQDKRQNTGEPDPAPDRDTAFAVLVNRAGAPRQQTVPDQSYEEYIRQTERLQADINRLQRQMAYNRSVIYSVAPPPNYNQPYSYNTAPPPAGSYPVSVPASGQTTRDTIVIRDTVYLTKTDTITKNVPTAPATVVVTVPKEKIVKEIINYTKLPPENILFATGQATIRKVYVEKLDYLAGILRQNPELMISISGHTDKTGSPEANEVLSLKRANAVKMFFIRRGINESRMQLKAVAADDPLVTGDTKNAKTQNRRVEIKIFE